MKKHLLLLIFVLAFANLYAQRIFTQTLYNYGDEVLLKTENISSGTIFLYKDVAMLPLIDTIPLSASQSSYVVPVTLEPGEYRARVVDTKGNPIDAFSFQVDAIPFAHTDHSLFLMTDIHVMSEDLIINDGTALQNTLQNDRKLLRYSAEIFDALVDSIIQYKPEVVLIPGDLTKDGELLSHNQVLQGLERLKVAGISCYVIPGNHDFNNPNSASFDGDTKSFSPTINADDFRHLYHSFGYDETKAIQDTSSLSYAVELFDGLTLIGIDATRCYENTIKALGADANRSYGGGLLRQSTLDWVLDRADEAYTKGNQIIAMMHHQMIDHFDGQKKMISSAAIEQGDSIAQLFMQHNIRVLFTGHMHVSNISVAYNEQLTDSLVEISTGATVAYPCPYRWLTFNSDFSTLEVNTRNLLSIASEPLLLEYSRNEMASKVEMMMTSVVRTYSNELVAQKKQVEKMDIVGKLAKAMPDDPDEMAALIAKYMNEPMQAAYLTMSEGNENLKLTSRIIDMAYQGYDNMVLGLAAENNFSLIETYTLRSDYCKKLIMAMILSKVEKQMNSVLLDCTNYGTPYQNTTNDLYLTLTLPIPTIRASVENIESLYNNCYYDVLGRQYLNKPTDSGIYIFNGEKVFIQ